MPATGWAVQVEEVWTVVETPHFRVVGEEDPARVTQVALAGERLISVLDRFTSLADFAGRERVTFYAFGTNESYRPYGLGGDWGGAGFLQYHPHGLYAAFVTGAEPTRQIHRQLVLHLLASRFPRLPEWFRQGIAEFYSNIRFIDGEIHVGLPIQGHMWLLRLPAEELDLQEVLLADAGAAASMDDFHVRAWALVHYLILGDPGLRPKVDAYLSGLERSARPERAFEEAFGMPTAAMGEKVEAYPLQETWPFLRLPVGDLSRPELTARALTSIERDLMLADLRLHTVPARLASVLDELRDLSGEASEDPTVLASLGEAEGLAGNSAAAVEALRRSVELDGTAFKPRLLLGEELLRSASGSDDSTDALREAVDVLERAVTLRPDSFAAWERLAFSYASLSETSERALEANDQVVRLRPGRTDLVFNLLLLRARREETSEVRILLGRLEALGASKVQVTAGREMLLQLTLREARRLLMADKNHDAIAALTEVHARTTDEATRKVASDWLGRVKRVEQHNQFADLYNQAAHAFNADDWVAATQALDALDVIVKPGRQTETVEHLRREVDYWRE